MTTPSICSVQAYQDTDFQKMSTDLSCCLHSAGDISILDLHQVLFVLAPSGGEGADAAIDCVGGQLIGDIVSAVRPGGAVMSFGSLAGQNEKLQVWCSCVQHVCGASGNRSCHGGSDQQRQSVSAAVLVA